MMAQDKTMPVIWIVTALLLSSCERIPFDAFGSISAPLPDRARLVSNEEYAELERSGRFYPITARDLSASPTQGQTRPEPETDEATPESFYDGAHAQNFERLMTAQTVARAPVRIIAPSCDQEEGATTSRSDRTAGKTTPPSCSPAPKGLYSLYDWPAKPYLTCVKAQGTRATCAAFAVASAIESLAAQRERRWVNLSEQALYQHAKLIVAPDLFDENVIEWLLFKKMSTERWRIPLEAKWEYNPSAHRRIHTAARRYTRSCKDYEGECSDSAHQMPIYCTHRAGYRYCGFLAIPQATEGFGITDAVQIWDNQDPDASLTRMLAALQLGYPVVWSIQATHSWDQVNAQGFVAYKGSSQKIRGTHVVHVTGAIDNKHLAQILPNAPFGPGGGYLIVKNSWGACWGDGGYGYVPYEYARSYTRGAAILAP